MEIFHRQIDEEKQKLGINRDVRCPATYITIHRNRILEDGYTQLSLLSTAALKRTIRVKFVNEQVCIFLFVCVHAWGGKKKKEIVFSYVAT